jgi:sugar lactone lactonase YvrE
MRIRKVTPAGVVTTFAGSGSVDYIDGPGAVAGFLYPAGIAVDTAGNVYVGDTNHNRIRKINSAGVVSTEAGDGTKGFKDATGLAAEFFQPTGLIVDAKGNLLIADNGNNRIRKITPTGVVTTFSGNGVAGR